MRDILISIQVATGLTAGIFFAAAFAVFGDGGMFASLLHHFAPNTCFGISIALFAISYALWFATRDEY